MPKSMTGFGRGVAQDEQYSIVVEMKAVNHRFLEINIRQPKQFYAFEDRLKKQIQNELDRGKVDVFLTFEYITAKNTVIKVDTDLAFAYQQGLRTLQEITGLDDEIHLREIAAFPGVMTVDTPEDDTERLAALAQQAMGDALCHFLSMRTTEGAAMAADLCGHLDHIEETVDKISVFAPQVVQEQKQRLEQRIADLLGTVEVDQAKLANEIAFFADKVDISEELARLRSHIAQFRETLTYSVPIGRKLEFILQEMLRETNTIGSKCNALNISRLVIENKSTLEKVREQIQNVE